MAVPQRPLRLLSLDGGGIRGLSTLFILRSIMNNLRGKAGLDLASPLHPCDYFDLIAGTSTGGLIAVMLGTLRMDIQTCIDEYVKMAPDIFPVKGFIPGNKLVKYYTAARGSQYFKAEPLELAIKSLVKKYLGDKCTQGEDTPFRFEAAERQGDHACKVFVCVTSEKLGKHSQFRSYNSSWDNIDDCPIWQACRATSAAPTFFPPMQIGNPPVAYVDGGLGYNNPIRVLIDETSHIWPSRQIGCIVSIGNGASVSRDVGRTLKPLFERLKDMATDTEKVAREFEEEMKHRYGNKQEVYFRFNVQQDLEQVGLEEWKEMETIEVATHDYLKSHWSQIEACSTQIFDPKAPAILARSEGTAIRHHNVTTEELECLRSFWPEGLDYEFQKDQNPRRVPNTCRWTLQNPKYISWRDSDTMKLLWISADPGCGKSVLARCIIDEDLPKASPSGPSKPILYYFFKDTSPEQRSATRAVSTILYQLFECQPRLIHYAIPTYRKIGKALSTTFPELWSIFMEAVTDPLVGDITCVLDALDECNEQGQHFLIEALKDFYLSRRKSSSASRLKFLITSRPYFNIRRSLDELLEASINIELAANDESENIKKEIDLVIKYRVKELQRENRLTPKLTDYLEKRLLEIEHRTYLWLHLVWEIMRKSLSGTKSELDRIIDDLPDDIQGSYEVLLQRSPEPKFARTVLQLVLIAARPLTLSEMGFALALSVDKETSSYTDLDLELETPSRLQETLPSRCGLMVSIINARVYFIHQTVKEFLLGKVGTQPSARRIWQSSFDLVESHHLMANICLRSITSPEIRLDQTNLCNALLPKHDREMRPNAYCQAHGFLSYSAIYWADHFLNKRNNEGIQTLKYVLEPNDPRLVTGRRGINYGNTLHAASAGGHAEIVQILLEKGANVNTEGGDSITALGAASFEGHTEIVQILLEKGAKVNIQTQSGPYGTALVAASFGGHTEIVQILLEKGAEVNAAGRRYGTALEAASLKGHTEIVQILLEKGAEVNAEGRRYGTALETASLKGHTEIVQILLEKGAEVNAEGRRYGTALEAASLKGHTEIVQILLENGAAVNAGGRLTEQGNLDGATNLRKDIVEEGIGLIGVERQAMLQDQKKGKVAEEVVRLVPEGREKVEVESSAASLNSSDASQEPDYSTRASSLGMEEYPDTDIPYKPNGFDDDDIMSVVSDKDDIGSQLSTRGNPQEIAAKERLAMLLARNSSLSPLYEEAFRKMERGRFVRNFRKLLKQWYLDLLPYGHNNLEKATIQLLKSHRNRYEIARLIVGFHAPINNEARAQIEQLEQKTQDTSFLEKWIADNADLASQLLPAGPEERINMGIEEDQDFSESSDEEDSVQEGENEETNYVEEMEIFLVKGKAFQKLLMNLQMFLLPTSLHTLLQEEIVSIPRNNIWLSPEEDNSIANRWKIFIEQITEDDWNWWPFRAKVRRLRDDEIRLHWKCHCNMHLWRELPKTYAEGIEKFLEYRGSESRQEHPCGMRRRRNDRNWTAVIGVVKFAAGAMIGQNWWYGSSSAASSSQSQPTTNVRHTPPSGESQDIPLRQQPTTNRQRRHPISIDIPQKYVFFGVEGRRRTLEVAQIVTVQHDRDVTFFTQIKREYRQCRGALRYWFSLRQFNHCQFFKFEKFSPNRVWKLVEDLPTDDRYEYAPKPPQTKPPHIDRHRFELALSACYDRCVFSSCHDCIEPPDGTYFLDHTPKRNIPLEMNKDGEELFWGLYARHTISLVYVFFYHFLIVVGTFGFWAWWLSKHPDDLQNAAVPFTMVSVFLSLFWSSAGILKNFREPA